MHTTIRDVTRPARRSGYLLVALAAALWATLGIVSRFVLRDGVDPLELGFWRALIGGALFATQAIVQRRTRLQRGDWPAVGAFAVIGVALFYFSYLCAVREGGAALAAILLYTAPAWVLVGSVLWLGERVSLRVAGVVVLTLAGVALVALAGPRSGPRGAGLHPSAAAIAWGLVSGVAYASYYIFGKRYLTRYAPATLFMYALPLGALVLLPAVHFAPRAAATWGGIAFIGVVPTFAALHVYSAGLRRLDATRAVTVATLEPVIAAALAYAVWDERLGALGYAGAALVLAGVLIMSRETDRPPPLPRTSH